MVLLQNLLSPCWADLTLELALFYAHSGQGLSVGVENVDIRGKIGPRWEKGGAKRVANLVIYRTMQA